MLKFEYSHGPWVSSINIYIATSVNTLWIFMIFVSHLPDLFDRDPENGLF